MIYYWRRIGASVIDLSIINMLSTIFFPLTSNIVTLTYSNIFVDLFKIFANLLIFIIIAVGYNVLCYRFFKYPLGKLLLNIKILGENEERVNVKQYFLREYNKYVLIYATFGLYIPYQFFVNVVKKKQTFHDKQGKTHVYISN